MLHVSCRVAEFKTAHALQNQQTFTFKSFVLGLHRQFKGEMEIKRFLTIFQRRKERREAGGGQGRRELIEEGKELGNWGCHYYKSLNFPKRR